VPSEQSNYRLLKDDLAAATGMFPDLAAKKIFRNDFSTDFTKPARCSIGPGDTDRPLSPVTIAFNNRNELVVGSDGYYAQGHDHERAIKQLYLYRTPLTKQTPDYSIRIPMGAPGEVNFDENDRFMVQDHTWFRVWLVDIEERDVNGTYVWLEATPH
jgi:hypothetical protein